jgi:hypothetical protein
MPVDKRGRLAADPFHHVVTKDGRVLVTRSGRNVGVVAGARAERLRAQLAAATDERVVQLLLARATGQYRHGTEHRISE